MLRPSKSVLIEKLLSQGLITENLVVKATQLQRASGPHIFIGEALMGALRDAIEDALQQECATIDMISDASKGHEFS